MFIVGLTGGIGSGKSAAAACFSALGITVVDADWAARVVVEPGQPALEKIAAHFGAQVLREDGGLDRARLRSIIFDSEEQRRWLEQLLHPLIREEILRSLNASQSGDSKSSYSILESPLLIESGQYQLVNRICVVDLPEALQIERASARDASDPQQIRQIMAAQLSREERRARADDVLDNSGTLVELRQQVAMLHERYLRLATESRHR
jgi:dephospho-CoA kinase